MKIKTTLAHPAVQAGWCDGCSPDNCGGCATPAAPAQVGKYPELPVPLVLESGYGLGDVPDAYTADQMRAYVDADRAARKPLTDEKLHALYAEVMTGHYANALHYWVGTHGHRFARAIEQAHGIKATNPESNK